MTQELPPVGLGTWNNDDEDLCTRAVEYALNNGYRHIDTAAAYGNESYVGRGLANADVDREDVIIATKVKRDHLRPEFVRASVQRSLDRLGINYIDILYVHWPLESYAPERTMNAFAELKDEGLIQNIGVSNFTVDHLKEVKSVTGVDIFAAQFEMHPLFQNTELLMYLREHDIYHVAYSPVGHGFIPWVPEMRQLADKYDVSPAQVSIAWLVDKENVVTIPKGDTPRFIEENITAVDLELNAEDIELIDAIDRQRKMINPFFAPWN